jgi:cobalt/nickel transport system permease protein
MHIPDGYLSPATCATLYAAAIPFWSAALRKMRALASTRTIPMVSLFGAFSFVVMMFNLPLPGGTTGHAVGVAVAAIVLGPWASMLAISVALVIQAVFFGDGGITAIGANCFNIAIVGSFVAHAVYRLGSGNAPVQSRRRVIAAGLAGYVAINVAAFVTAIEFGIQPMLFSAPDGTPLYAPYPLSIAVPAMMLGHLTFAGLAEAIVSAGIVAYLQRAEPSLLAASMVRRQADRVRSTFIRPLWAALGLLMIATPVGLIAAGAAWGEWGAEDFATPAGRTGIAAASLNAVPPSGVPRGLERLSSIWTAPIPDYAPAFVRSERFGYVMSAAVGAGLVILGVLLLQRLTAGRRRMNAREPM